MRLSNYVAPLLASLALSGCGPESSRTTTAPPKPVENRPITTPPGYESHSSSQARKIGNKGKPHGQATGGKPSGTNDPKPLHKVLNK